MRVGRIRVSRRSDRVATPGHQRVAREVQHRLSAEELASVHRAYFQGDGTDLSLVESEFGPDTVIRPHAHDRDEIVVVTAGQLRAGAHVLEPGDALYVEAKTLYGFVAGPSGCTFLNFRQGRSRYIAREEFLEERGNHSGGTA